MARTAMAAQLRLADTQPAAYRTFDAEPASYAHLRARPLEAPGAWVVSPFRDALVLTHTGIADAAIEVPTTATFDAVWPGDHVWLTQSSPDFTSGPWTVIRSRRTSRVAHPVDREGTSPTPRERDRPSRVRWLQLRGGPGLGAAARPVKYGGSGLIVRVKPDELRALRDEVADDAAVVIAAAADRLRNALQATAREHGFDPTTLVDPLDPRR